MTTKGYQMKTKTIEIREASEGYEVTETHTDGFIFTSIYNDDYSLPFTVARWLKDSSIYTGMLNTDASRKVSVLISDAEDINKGYRA